LSGRGAPSTTNQNNEERTAVNDTVINRVYFIDDLSRRVADALAAHGASDKAVHDELRAVRGRIHAALGCVDFARQRYALNSWDDILAQLAASVARPQTQFDLIVSRGSNGPRLVRALRDRVMAAHGYQLAFGHANVELGHYLTNPSNPLPWEAEVSVGSSFELGLQLDAALARARRVRRIGVIDDCITTGAGVKAIADSVLRLTLNTEVSILGLALPEQTRWTLRALQYPTIHGLLTPAYDSEVYLVKDLVLGAVRFTDGSARPYTELTGWMGRLFGDSPHGAIDVLSGMRERLVELGLDEELRGR
jgi:hypothetical protein